MGPRIIALLGAAGVIASVVMFLLATPPSGGPTRLERITYSVGLNDQAEVEMKLAAAHESLSDAIREDPGEWRAHEKQAAQLLASAAVEAEEHQLGDSVVARIERLAQDVGQWRNQPDSLSEPRDELRKLIRQLGE